MWEAANPTSLTVAGGVVTDVKVAAVEDLVVVVREMGSVWSIAVVVVIVVSVLVLTGGTVIRYIGEEGGM